MGSGDCERLEDAGRGMVEPEQKGFTIIWLVSMETPKDQYVTARNTNMPMTALKAVNHTINEAQLMT